MTNINLIDKKNFQNKIAIVKKIEEINVKNVLNYFGI
jgi:hypothetical protein